MANPVTKPVDNALLNRAEASETSLEYDEKKLEYKEAMKYASSEADRKTLMRMHREDLIDIAVDAEENKEWMLKAAIDRRIDSLDKRTYTARRGKY